MAYKDKGRDSGAKGQGAEVSKGWCCISVVTIAQTVKRKGILESIPVSLLFFVTFDNISVICECDSTKMCRQIEEEEYLSSQ